MAETTEPTTLKDAILAYEAQREQFDLKGTAKSAILSREYLQDIITFSKQERKTIQELRKAKKAKKAAKAS